MYYFEHVPLNLMYGDQGLTGLVGLFSVAMSTLSGTSSWHAESEKLMNREWHEFEWKVNKYYFCMYLGAQALL